MSTVDNEIEKAPPRWRVIAGWVTTVLAGLLVLFALVAPNELDRLTPLAFLRIPIEALVVVTLVVLLPERARRWVAIPVGLVLGILTILKAFDIGFFGVLDRPFDPFGDWSFLTAGTDYVARSSGTLGAIAAVAVAAALAVGVVVGLTRSVLRLTRLVRPHRTAALRSAVALGVAWAVCAVFGVQLVPGEPVAAGSAAALAYDKAAQVGADIHDHRTFATDADDDPFRDTPAAQLVPGLRGKDVLIVFVESYGRVAIEDPQIAPGVNAALAAGTAQLQAAGFGIRSGFLSSSTYAGGSWLAHSTFESGMWINTQQRYTDLLASDRLTLTGALRRAGWRTIAAEPANFNDLPEAKEFDKVYDERNLGYRGERFNFNSMPDQYTLGAVQRAELTPAHTTPVVAQIALLSSHSPWAPIPELSDWNIGVGYGYTKAPVPAGEPSDLLLRGFDQVRADYGQSVQYSLRTLISYVQTYGNDNQVLVMLGDHQPAATVTGATDNRDVPISIVAHDPAVLNQLAGWGWTDALKPEPQAPVWRMDTFRDKFLTAFGSTPTPAH